MSAVPEISLRPAVFLDRDGVLNRDLGYVHRMEQVEWVTDVIPALKALRSLGFTLVIATNQSGIARGYFSEQDFLGFMVLYRAALQNLIDYVYYCPHHPMDGLGSYLRTCDCRKPGNGMIEQAISDHQLDRSRCIFIGDRASDMEAARRSQIQGLEFTGKNLAEFIDQHREIFRKILE